MLPAIVILCFTGGAIARLALEIHNAPVGYEGRNSLTIVEKPLSVARRSWIQRTVVRFSGIGSGKPILFGRPG